jgi:hypothetical protein
VEFDLEIGERWREDRTPFVDDPYAAPSEFVLDRGSPVSAAADANRFAGARVQP